MMTRDKLMERLSKLPKVTLGSYPTPLQELQRLSERLGVRVFLKREDLSGPTLTTSGNKTRMLQYRLAKAVEQGADIIVSGFDLQSNHARQVTAASRQLGLDVRLILRRGRWKKTEAPQGNYLLDLLMGAVVQVVDIAPTAHAQLLYEEAARLRAQGRHPYVTGYDDESLSAVAFVECGIELLGQLEQLKVEANYLYLPSEGATQAGLALAAKCTGSSHRIVGINPIDWIKDAPGRIAGLANDAARILGLEVTMHYSEVANLSEYVGMGYGEPTPEGNAAIRLLAETEGVLLDPVYTGKAMAALLEHISRGSVKDGDVVVFVHTGGTPALFSYGESLAGGHNHAGTLL